VQVATDKTALEVDAVGQVWIAAEQPVAAVAVLSAREPFGLTAAGVGTGAGAAVAAAAGRIERVLAQLSRLVAEHTHTLLDATLLVDGRLGRVVSARGATEHGS
jgi:hypothetical protein